MRRAFRFLALAGALALAGCGGDEFLPAPPDARVVRRIEAVKLDAPAMLATLNAYRAAHGLGALALDAPLAAMAQHQADAMAASGQLSHNVTGSFSGRLAQANIAPTEAGENLGAGYYSGEEAMAGWRGSPEHNENLLKPGFTRLGLAIARNPQASYGVFWAMELAGPERLAGR